MFGFGFAFTLMGLVVLSAVALTSSALGGRLRNSPPLAGVLRWLTCSVLVALGLSLAIPERQ